MLWAACQQPNEPANTQQEGGGHPCASATVWPLLICTEGFWGRTLTLGSMFPSSRDIPHQHPLCPKICNNNIKAALQPQMPNTANPGGGSSFGTSWVRGGGALRKYNVHSNNYSRQKVTSNTSIAQQQTNSHCTYHTCGTVEYNTPWMVKRTTWRERELYLARGFSANGSPRENSGLAGSGWNRVADEEV